MTDNVKPLFPGQPTGTDPVPEVVEMVEDLLSRAKSGELQSLAFAGLCSDDTVMSGCSVQDDVLCLIGAPRVVENNLTRMVDR